MLRVSLRNLLVNKLRLLLTIAAVTVGVTFVSGTFVLSDTMVKAFDELYDGLDRRHRRGGEVGGRLRRRRRHDRRPGPPARPGPRATGAGGAGRGRRRGVGLRLRARPRQSRRPRSSPAAPRRSARASPRTAAWPGPPPSARAARPPARTRSRWTRARPGTPATHSATRSTWCSRTVAGPSRWSASSASARPTACWGHPRRVRPAHGAAGARQGGGGRRDRRPGRARHRAPQALRDRIAEVLPDGVQALTGEQVAADGTAAVRDAMGIFTTVLLVFAGVSLLVGSFVIWNTFNVLVAQRRREVALLRAVGATRRQVLAGVLVEAAVIGLVAGGLGLLLGVALAAGIRALLELIGVELPTTSPAVETRTLVAGAGRGAARDHGRRDRPGVGRDAGGPHGGAAQRRAARWRRARGRRIAGWALTTGGLAGLAVAAGIGQPALVDGPRRRDDVRRPGHPRARPSRGEGAAGRPRPTRRRLAVRGAQHRPELTALGRHRARAHDRSDRGRRGRRDRDLAEGVGLGRGERRQPLGPDPRARRRRDRAQPLGGGLLRARDDVRDVVELRESSAQVNGHGSLVTAMDTAGLARVIDLGVESGSLDALEPGTMLVSTEAADEPGGRRGRPGHRHVRRDRGTTMRVVGTFSKGSLINAATSCDAGLHRQCDLAPRRRDPGEQRPGVDPAGPRRRSRRRSPTTPT